MVMRGVKAGRPAVVQKVNFNPAALATPQHSDTIRIIPPPILACQQPDF
jgi:hypothetical protein